MAYSVNWITKVITIPVSDLTLVSGSRYRLFMSAFLIECRRLESAFAEGLWAEQILVHDDKKVDFAGADYAAFDEVINGYTVQIETGPTRVDLIGSNNNILDVLIATGVSVASFNSAGLQIVETGVSGLTAAEAQVLTDLHDEAFGRWDLITTGSPHQLVYYRSDGLGGWNEIGRFNMPQDVDGKYLERVPV